MDAVEFVKTIQRKIKNENRDEIIIRTTDDANLLVDLTEEWEKDNPIKTRQSIFLEKYPEARIDDSGVLSICPFSIVVSYRNNDGTCVSPDKNRSCHDCRRKFWLKQVDE